MLIKFKSRVMSKSLYYIWRNALKH